jgi:hypothetical protein
MIYDVNESRFFEILGIKELKEYNARILKINEEKGIAYFNLLLDLNYLNIDEETKSELVSLPIEFNVRENEKLDVVLKELFLEVKAEKGIDLTFDISVDITEEKEEIEEIDQDTLVKAEQIKEVISPDIIEEKELSSDEEKFEVNISTNCEKKDFNISNFLRNSYQKYKMIILDDEANFDKISLKYSIKMEDLFRMKKEGLKVIVCAKE